MSISYIHLVFSFLSPLTLRPRSLHQLSYHYRYIRGRISIEKVLLVTAERQISHQSLVMTFYGGWVRRKQSLRDEFVVLWVLKALLLRYGWMPALLSCPLRLASSLMSPLLPGSLLPVKREKKMQSEAFSFKVKWCMETCNLQSGECYKVTSLNLSFPHFNNKNQPWLQSSFIYLLHIFICLSHLYSFNLYNSLVSLSCSISD